MCRVAMLSYSCCSPAGAVLLIISCRGGGSGSGGGGVFKQRRGRVSLVWCSAFCEGKERGPQGRPITRTEPSFLGGGGTDGGFRIIFTVSSEVCVSSRVLRFKVQSCVKESS